MKARIIFGLIILLVLNVSANFAQEIILTTTAANTVASKATIDMPALSNNPNAIIVATPLGNTPTSNPNPIGAWYYNNKWNIFNTNHAIMPNGSTFKVQVFLTPGANQFLHIIPLTDNGQGFSFIDNPELNNNPNAQVQILQNHAPDNRPPFLNPNEARVLYDTAVGKWYIQNVNLSALNAKTAYNVVIASSGGGGSKIVPTKTISNNPPNLHNQPTTPNSNAGGDLSGNYPNPIVVGLNGKPLSNTAPAIGDTLRWSGTAWEPYTPPANSLVNANQLLGRDIVTTAPTTGQVLKWGGSSWYPADDNVGNASTVPKPSVLFFNQSNMVNVYDPNVDTKPIVGLDNQSFTLPQSSRIVFNTVIMAKSFGLFQANATGIQLTVEILNASNAMVARATSAGWVTNDTPQNLVSTGIGVLPAGTYHTKVTFIRQAGGAKIDVVMSGYGYPNPTQGGQMIIQIFPD